MGPLASIKVLEIGGIGPVPFCGMMLADLGADILRIERPQTAPAPLAPWADFPARGRPILPVDLKTAEGRALIKELAASADVLIEGFRPGVMERLELGPDALQDVNPKLIYGRMTGWGQSGPMAMEPGHDINYIALNGVLSLLGRAGAAPTPPANLIGDFGGGALYLLTGVLSALIERGVSGRGQTVDAAMVDGSASLVAAILGFRAAGVWRDERGVNLLDTGAPFYDVYECACGGHVAVGAIEPPFYAALLEGLGLRAEDLPDQMDRSRWPVLKERFAACFAARSRDEWAERFAGAGACVTPVLSLNEAKRHPHLEARGVYVDVGGHDHAAPAPRFSRSPLKPPAAPLPLGEACADALRRWGASADRISRLIAEGAVSDGDPAS